MAYVGEKIKKRRKELNLTIAQIKEKTGISTGNLSEIENGKKLPSAPALLALSNALNCSCDWILKEDIITDNILKRELTLDEFETDLIRELRTLPTTEQLEIFEIIKLKKNKLKKDVCSTLTNSENSSKYA